MTKSSDNRSRKRLLTSILLSTLAGVVGYLIDVGLFANISLFQNLHWTIWVAGTLIIYLLISFLVDKYDSGQGPLNRIFRIPLWTELRAFGEQPTAKFSYWALLIIPMLAYLARTHYFSSIVSNYQFPLSLKLAYFASWFIALSLIIFSVSCPTKLRNKKLFERVKTVNLVLNNVDSPNISIRDEEEEIDITLDQYSLVMRTLCFSFFVFGIVTFLIILFRSALVVFNA